MANAVVGFQNANRAQIGATQESLWSVITTIRPDETYLLSTLGTVEAQDIIHFWPTYTPRSIGSRAAAEGVDPTPDNPDTSRSFNVTQIINVAYQLTGSRAKARGAVGGDPMAFAKDQAMQDWGQFAEFDYLRGSLNSGNNSVARRMRGIRHFASTYLTSQSGVSLSETTMNDYFLNAWQGGIEIDTVLVGSRLKRRISGFSANNTRWIEAKDNTLINKIEVYEAEHGLVKLKMHRYVTQQGDNNFDFIGLQTDLIKIANYREPVMQDLAKTGDAENGFVVGETSIQVGSEKAVNYAQAHL